MSLRRLALEQLIAPVVMETHGGYGRIYLDCYTHLQDGIVFERDDRKVLFLAEQRPTWAVYQADCVEAIRNGAGNHLPVNFLDVDPYGDPWGVIDAFLQSDRPHPDKLVIVTNDGLRRNTMMNFSWKTGALESVVEIFGNNLYPKYMDACKFLMESKAAQAGYAMHRFVGYYCGVNNLLTHYLAVLIRS